MTQAQTLSDIAARLSFIQEKLCLEAAYVTLVVPDLFNEDGSIISATDIPITLATDPNDTVNTFLESAQLNLAAAFNYMIGTLVLHKANSDLYGVLTVRDFYESSDAIRVLNRAYISDMNATRFKLSNIESDFLLFLSRLMGVLVSEYIPSALNYLGSIGISQSGIYDIPDRTKWIVIQTAFDNTALYSNRISISYQNRYLFGGISFIYDIGYSSNEIDIQWIKQIIEVPTGKPTKFGIYLRGGLEVTILFYS